MNEIVESMPQEQSISTQSSSIQATPADIVMYAMKNGGSIDQIRDFMQLQRDWESGEARKAYVAAMVEFKKNPPVVIKDKKVGFINNNGEFVGYTHASLGNLTGKIIKGLAEHGFSHEWKTTQESGMVRVTCIITHRLGHSEANWLESQPDETGKKGSIQRIGSAVTFLQRYTLQGATGIATVEDDDGIDSGDQNVDPEGKLEKKEPIKPSINGVRFAAGIEKIKSGEFTAERMRKAYALTVDQETALDDAVSELK